MTETWSAPSKTFLVGEYAVLRGAPALVLNTHPRFELQAERRSGQAFGLNSGSPAAVWLDRQSLWFQNWTLTFNDPHAGRGGFGASSAQFLLAWALRRGTRELDLATLLHDFHAVNSAPASGCDLLGQALGQVAQVEKTACQTATRTWPYPEIQFYILRTGHKLPTHQHLRDLSLDRLAPLEPTAIAAVNSFGYGPAEEFLRHVQLYAEVLTGLELTAEPTLKLLRHLRTQPWCLAAKGCGAMGADTILLFSTRANEAQAKAFFNETRLELVATAEDLTSGLERGASR